MNDIRFTKNRENIINYRPGREIEQNDFDLRFEHGIFKFVCGYRTGIMLLSESKIYAYKNKSKTFPLYDKSISFNNGDFDSSDQVRQAYDNVKYKGGPLHIYEIPMDNYSKYYVFKTSLDNYGLFIIDSSTKKEGCPPEEPNCCENPHTAMINATFILQTNGLPQFTTPTQVLKPYNKQSPIQSLPSISKTMDLQGRIITAPQQRTGIRLLITDNKHLQPTLNISQ